MSVERTQTGHEIRYELRHGAALVCVLIFGEPEVEPVAWKILLPGPGGTEDLYATKRFRTPGARQLQAWLTPIVGTGPAAELTGAVDAQPPLTSGWERHHSGCTTRLARRAGPQPDRPGAALMAVTVKYPRGTAHRPAAPIS